MGNVKPWHMRRLSVNPNVETEIHMDNNQGSVYPAFPQRIEGTQWKAHVQGLIIGRPDDLRRP